MTLAMAGVPLGVFACGNGGREDSAEQRAQQARLEAEQRRVIEQQEAARQLRAVEQTVTGTVASRSKEVLVIDREGEPPLRLRIEGSNVTVSQLEPGERVRVTYRLQNDEPLAVRVEEAPDVRPVRGTE